MMSYVWPRTRTVGVVQVSKSVLEIHEKKEKEPEKKFADNKHNNIKD